MRCSVASRRPGPIKGLCSIHAVMIEAEQQMRNVLAAHSLADLAARVGHKAPKAFPREVAAWFGARKARRRITAGEK